MAEGLRSGACSWSSSHSHSCRGCALVEVRPHQHLPTISPSCWRKEIRSSRPVPGVLKRLWRVPGRTATIGLYEADDPAALHDALMSLPMAPWLDVHVEALATHPQERT